MSQGEPPGEANAGVYACKCCGYKTLSDDRWDICPICFWEDDPVQGAFYDYPGGANHVSLREAQRNFLEFGASERRLLPYVRKPNAEDERDPDFRYLEYSPEDARKWGQRIAGYADQLRDRLAGYSDDRERYSDTLFAARNFLTECEMVYREYKYPEHNTENYHDFRISVNPNDAFEWAQNQLANWLWIREHQAE